MINYINLQNFLTARKRKSISYTESSEEEDHSSDPDYTEKPKRVSSSSIIMGDTFKYDSTRNKVSVIVELLDIGLASDHYYIGISQMGALRDFQIFICAKKQRLCTLLSCAGGLFVRQNDDTIHSFILFYSEQSYRTSKCNISDSGVDLYGEHGIHMMTQSVKYIHR
jgi:hypothetical protein